MAEWGTVVPGAMDSSNTEEGLLLARLKRIENSPSGYYLVHLHLSDLRKNNRQSHFVQIAARTFDGVVENHDATLFPLTNADLVLICRDVPVDDVDNAVDKVRSLFSEDPLTAVDDTGFEDRFATWYDLTNSEDFAAFFGIAADLSLEAERRQEEAARLKDREAALGTPLEPKNLSDINNKLIRARVADLMGNQTCLLVRSGGGGEVVFREQYISLSKVKERIAPDVNFFASPWLFQFLTEALDRRLLSILSQQEFEDVEDSISINLNIATVLSRDFQKFHQAVGEKTDKVVVELQMIDVFADTKNYGYARDSLQERGYRILIDGLTASSLYYFDPAMLRSDFLKVTWNQDLEGDNAEEQMIEMKETIARVGKESLILARVDTEKAVKWGLSIGISRFQGFFIDRLAQVIGSGKSL